MEKGYEYGELLYFGNEYNNDSLKLQSEFISEIKEHLPSAKLRDCYDEIKGYRQEVIIPNGEKDNLFAWLIAYGWFDFGLSMQVLMMSDDKESKDLINYYIRKAKEKYPNNFKKESNEESANNHS